MLHLSRAPAFGWSDDGVAWDSPGAGGSGRAALCSIKTTRTRASVVPSCSSSSLSLLFPLTPSHPLVVRQIRLSALVRFRPLISFQLVTSYYLPSAISHSSLRLIPRPQQRQSRSFPFLFRRQDLFQFVPSIFSTANLFDLALHLDDQHPCRRRYLLS